MPRIIPVDYRTLIQVFEIDGFAISRQKRDPPANLKKPFPFPLLLSTPHLAFDGRDFC